MTTSDTLTKLAGVSFKGKGKGMRETAFASIAPQSYVESKGRAAVCSSIAIALQLPPMESRGGFVVDETLRNACKIEWMSGRVADRVDDSEFPDTVTDVVAAIDYVREQIRFYAAPSEAKGKAPKLRAYQKGRRTPTMHKAIRASEQAWSQVEAELGIGGAVPEKKRKRKARAAAKATSQSTLVKLPGGGIAALPTGADIAGKPAEKVTARSGTQHVVGQLAALQQYVNKYAKVLPADIGMLVQRAKREADTAMNALLEREAAADAAKAEKEK